MRSPFTTVAQAVAEAGTIGPDRGFVFQDNDGKETHIKFPEVEQLTSHRAAALQALGLKKGDRVGLVIIEPEDFVLTFLAAVRAGMVPVPMYPPMSFGKLDAYADRTGRILASSGAQVLVASERLQNVLWGLVDKIPTLKRVVAAESLRTAKGTPTWPTVDPSDLCFLQYTSGSTADPKGVMVTHASLVANCRGIINESLQLRPDLGETAVSWLPLYHDMGLIGFVIAPILYTIPTVLIPTLRFIKRPSVWLDTIHRHRGTVTFAPNFAFALAAKRVRDEDLDNWDLSCLHLVGCGAEPINAATMREFTELFSTRCKLPRNAVLPAYGMAEATLAIGIKQRPDTFKTLLLNADVFQHEGRAVAPTENCAVVEHVACGTAFSGHEIGVLGGDGEWLIDGMEGELCLRGPSVTAGYFQNSEATQDAFRSDGWLRTGDLGFVQHGQMYVTGRIKDLIIVNGRNVHPQAVEWVVAELPGVRRGNVVAFSVPGEVSEEVVVVVETKGDTPSLVDDVKRAINQALSISVSVVVCVPSGTLPKTSSGKLQRRKTRQMYLDGLFGVPGGPGPRTPGPASERITLARHVAASMWARAKAATLG